MERKRTNRLKVVLAEKGIAKKQQTKMLGVCVDDLLWTEEG